MSNSGLFPAAPQRGREPPTDKIRVVYTRKRVPTNWFSNRTLQPSSESVVANSLVQSNYLVGGLVSGLGTVYPLLTLSFFSTWILPIHFVFFCSPILYTKPFGDGIWMTGAGSGLSWRPLIHSLHVGGLGQMMAE